MEAIAIIDKNEGRVCTIYPAGFEEMFAEINASEPSVAKTIGEKFGNQFYPNDYFDNNF